MDQAILVKDEILAGAELARRYGEIRTLKAAFWLRGSEDDRASLYLAVDGFDVSDRGSAYLEMSQVVEEMSDPELRFFYLRVKLIGEQNSLARAAIELNQKFPDPLGHTLRNTMFGDMFAEEVFVYPTFLPAVFG